MKFFIALCLILAITVSAAEDRSLQGAALGKLMAMRAKLAKAKVSVKKQKGVTVITIRIKRDIKKDTNKKDKSVKKVAKKEEKAEAKAKHDAGMLDKYMTNYGNWASGLEAWRKTHELPPWKECKRAVNLTAELKAATATLNRCGKAIPSWEALLKQLEIKEKAAETARRRAQRNRNRQFIQLRKVENALEERIDALLGQIFDCEDAMKRAQAIWAAEKVRRARVLAARKRDFEAKVRVVKALVADLMRLYHLLLRLMKTLDGQNRRWHAMFKGKKPAFAAVHRGANGTEAKIDPVWVKIWELGAKFAQARLAMRASRVVYQCKAL